MLNKKFNLLFLSISLVLTSKAQNMSDDTLVKALYKVFGKHENLRASHAKGFCYIGNFVASKQAKNYSSAKVFVDDITKTPVIGRFSLAGGNPKASDKSTSARGLAARLLVSNNESIDFVCISAPIFFASTPEEFIGFLNARIPDTTTKKPNPEKIKTFSEAHPKTTKQAKWLATKGVPYSYSSTNYYGVHAFTLKDNNNKTNFIKWIFVTKNGEKFLTADELKNKSDTFYNDQFKMDLSAGEISWDLYAVLAKEGDNLTDPTEIWDNDRERVNMGTLSVSSLTEQSCDGEMFTPTRLIEGIGISNDPILRVRHKAYIYSTIGRQH